MCANISVQKCMLAGLAHARDIECTLIDPMQVTAHNVSKHVIQSGDGQLKSDLVQNSHIGVQACLQHKGQLTSCL